MQLELKGVFYHCHTNHTETSSTKREYPTTHGIPKGSLLGKGCSLILIAT